MQSEKCRFEHNGLYWDFESEGFVEFKCSEPVIKDGFCIFHHPEYWRENEEELRKKFYEKIRESKKKGKKLLCIGYNLPSIKIQGNLKSAVYFSWAKFHGKVNFSHTSFFREACFPYAEFFEGADFSNARFSGVADFYCAKFKWARYDRAKFSERALFTGLRKGSEKDPTHSTIDLLTDAKSAAELRKRSENDDPTLSFLNVEFDKPEMITFDEFNLANTCFLYADVSKISIGEGVSWGRDRRILDERKKDTVESRVTYDVVATIYRRLRQNLESKMRYTEAGRFYIGEMECKRKNVNVKNPVFRWLRTNILSALAWYKHMSNYGESYSRVILWIILTPMIAALLTTLTQMSNSTFTTNLLQNLRNYIFAFFQLKTSNLAELAVRITSLLLIGQLYISLRRQFERRYRG